ncbi:MAG: secretion protein HlyD [Proteobacteria bacterium]|nr:secretion protein HlyD [Pseudomonadota bacterium]
MSSKGKIALGVIVLAAAALGGWYWLERQQQHAETALVLYGNVDIREVELGFRVPGRLTDALVDEGDSVTKGQRLAIIDSEPYRQSVALAEARVQLAQANLAKFEKGSRPQEVQQAQARVEEAEAAYRNAQREYERQLGMFKSGSTSETARDAAQTRRDQTAAALAALREALALASEGFRSEEVNASRAEFAASVAQRSQAETQLADTELLSPSDGVVLSRIREPGSIVAIGAAVYSLSLRDPVYVRAYVGESDLGKLAPGTPVEVATDSSAKRYRGQVGYISPRAEFTPKSVETVDLRTDLVYRLRIIVADADDGLRQGMPVTISVPIRSTAP